MSELTIEQIARQVAADYDLHCEAIDDPDIDKLTEMIADALKQERGFALQAEELLVARTRNEEGLEWSAKINHAHGEQWAIQRLQANRARVAELEGKP